MQYLYIICFVTVIFVYHNITHLEYRNQKMLIYVIDYAFIFLIMIKGSKSVNCRE